MPTASKEMAAAVSMAQHWLDRIDYWLLFFSRATLEQNRADQLTARRALRVAIKAHANAVSLIHVQKIIEKGGR
jgi:hypothetical protein